jgi:hypothetical protein
MDVVRTITNSFLMSPLRNEKTNWLAVPPAGPGTYGGDSPSGDYERPYDETVYSQVPSSSASNSQATVETHRRVRDTRDGRESHRHRDRR